MSTPGSITISGSLKDASGKALASQTIAFAASQAGPVLAPVTTLADGTFKLPVTGVPYPGTTVFTISFAGASGLLASSTTAIAAFKKVSGSVSAVAAPGEQLTVTVTRPDDTVETILVIVQNDRTFSLYLLETQKGGYTLRVTIAKDLQYSAASSLPKPFTV